MNRTGLDTSALSRMLRRVAGGDSIEWVVEPIQASVLLDIADSLDENAKLRELCADLYAEMITYSDAPNYNASVWAPKLRELGIEVRGK